jgi:anhydro-N-acetylmuramic acid kinase
VFAFDTGPGNALIDAAVEIATAGRLTYDRDGALAAQGTVDEALLAELLAHPYFAQEPPKSSGREAFGRPFVERLVDAVRPEGDQDWLDLVATLTELTARSICGAYERWILPRGVEEVVLTGGGARNPTLVARIRALLDPLPVADSGTLGLGMDVKEALAFAVLAWAHMRRIPANVPEATGAKGPRVLGSLTPGCEPRREDHGTDREREA